MSRPSRKPTNASEAGWVGNINDNFAALMGTPAPLRVFTDEAELSTTFNPKLYWDCLANVSGVLYKSDGTDWVKYRTPVAFMADLDTGTATVADIRTAYNNLLSDLQSAGWMLT